jgi:hypothetical protein
MEHAAIAETQPLSGQRRDAQNRAKDAPHVNSPHALIKSEMKSPSLAGLSIFH